MIRHEVRCKSLPFQDGCRLRGTAPLRDDHCAGIGCTRTKFARCRVFDILFMIPFMTPPYITSMGWILFMQKKGLLQQLVPAAAGCEKIFFTLGGLVLVMGLHVFPFMLTMLKNAMLNIPSSLEEAGAGFGAGFGARMRKIFLPLLSGNYAIGALLVFVKILSEYGTPSTLGRRIGFEVFTTAPTS